MNKKLPDGIVANKTYERKDNFGRTEIYYYSADGMRHSATDVAQYYTIESDGKKITRKENHKQLVKRLTQTLGFKA